jgi:hypothetical protein
MAVAGCKRQDGEQNLPFKGRSVANLDCWSLWEAYAEDEEEADRKYKGKVVTLSVCSDPWHPFTDASGEKCVTRGMPGDPRDWHQKLRCYIYRPDNPLVRVAKGKGGYPEWTATGVCEGKINGIVVLRDCVFYEYWGGGCDW